MLRSSIGICVNSRSLNAILRSSPLNSPIVVQQIAIRYSKSKTDRAISPRLAIRIDDRGWTCAGSLLFVRSAFLRIVRHV